MTRFDILIPNDIVLETLELKMEDGREGFENDSLPRILQSISFGGVSILSFQRFDLNIVLERIFQSSESLDIELNVYNRRVSIIHEKRRVKLTVEILRSNRFEIDIDTRNVTVHLSRKDPLDLSIGRRTLSLTNQSASTRLQSQESNLTFIFVSSLSHSTRLNSWTSCCKKESNPLHPKDLVSSVVPTD